MQRAEQNRTAVDAAPGRGDMASSDPVDDYPSGSREELYSDEQVAAILGLSIESIRREMSRAGIPRRRGWPASEVRRYAASKPGRGAKSTWRSRFSSTTRNQEKPR